MRPKWHPNSKDAIVLAHHGVDAVPVLAHAPRADYHGLRFVNTRFCQAGSFVVHVGMRAIEMVVSSGPVSRQVSPALMIVRGP